MKAVFIDTFYDKSSQNETDKFVEYTNQLITFANNTRYFECKDIKTALTELMEAQQKIKEYEDILYKKEENNLWFRLKFGAGIGVGILIVGCIIGSMMVFCIQRWFLSYLPCCVQGIQF